MATEGNVVETRKDEPALFELKFAQVGGIGAPVVQFTWCLKPACLERIANAEARFPHMFVSIVEKTGGEISANLREVARQLIPLERGGGQIEFNRPGSFEINAAIVWTGTTDTSKTTLNRLLEPSRIGRTFALWMYEHHGDSVMDLTLPSIQFMGAGEVTVSDEFFAKRPPVLLLWWSGLWFERLPENECYLRRRMIVAFTIQPPLVALWILLRGFLGLVVVAVLALIGWRGIDPKPIFRPFSGSLDDIWFYEKRANGEFMGNSYAVTRKDGTRHPWWWKFLTMPILVMTELSFISLSAWLIWKLGAVGHFLMIFVPFFAAIFTILRFTGRLELSQAELVVLEAQRQRDRHERQVSATLAALQPLACAATAPSTGLLRDLPPEKRTLHLRFLDLKAKVCKPFATYYRGP